MTLARADHPLQLVAGLTVWAVWFTLVYAGVSVACDVAPSALRSGPWNPVTGCLLLFTMLVIALMAWAAWRCARAASRTAQPRADGQRDGRRFVAWVAAALYATSAVSTAFVGLPLLVLPPCA